MRSLGIIIVSPGGDRLARMSGAHEQRLVEKFVAHATVEALDKPVLRWLARRDIVPLDAGIAGP